MTTPAGRRHNACLLNAALLNFDGKLDFRPITDVVEVMSFDETTSGQLVERARGSNILITKELPVPKEVAQELPGTVEMICEAGTGTDNLKEVMEETTRITVCNIPEYSTESVAWLAMRFVIDLAVGEKYHHRTVEGLDVSAYYGRELQAVASLRGQTLGVIGAGAIGRRFMERGDDFGMKVLFCRSRDPVEGATGHVTLDELLERSDFVSIHVPLTKRMQEGHPLIGATELSRMKPGARLINTARGRVIDHDALIAALQDGHLGGAALDVQDPEPLPVGHALLSMDNVLVTPHIGWKELGSRRRLVDGVAKTIHAYIEDRPINVISRPRR